DGRDVTSAGGLPVNWVTEYDNIRLRGKLLGEWETSAGQLTVNFAAEYQDGQTPQTRNTVSAPGGFATPTARVLQNPSTNARTYDTETNIVSFDATLATAVGDFQFFTSYIDDDFQSVPEQTFPSPITAGEELATYELTYSFGEDQRVRRGELSGLVGLHFEDREQKVFAITLTPFGPLTADTSSSSETTSVYADLRYGLTDNLTIFGGARMLWFDATRTQGTVAPPAPPPIMSAPFTTTNLNEEEFLPAIGLAYYFSENNVLSASVRTGYNPGGVGVNAFLGNVYTFNSETVTTAEVTFRGENASGTLSYGATAFYNWHDDPQLFTETVPGNRFTLQVINQLEGESYGLELDGQWQATERLRFDAALGLLETEITQASAARPQLNGNSFGQDPNVTLSLGGEIQLTRVLSADARATYRGESFSDVNNTPGDKVGDFWLVDLGLTADFNDRTTLRAYVTNVFDEIGVTRFVGGGTFADVTAPRTFGMTLTSRF
ncbi:MAG: TonB-dependent receptor, partial [Pseudomonadota bacterium]